MTRPGILLYDTGKGERRKIKASRREAGNVQKKKPGMLEEAIAVLAIIALMILIGGCEKKEAPTAKTAAIQQEASISKARITATATPKPEQAQLSEWQARQKAAEAQRPKVEAKVYIANSKSKVYHSRKTCSGMKNPKEITLKEAEKEGKRPCKKCYKK